MRRSDQNPVAALDVAYVRHIGRSNHSMKTVFIRLPESVFGTGGETDEGLSRESQFLLALKLFELGRLNAKDAAAMCGVNVVDFLLFAEKAVLPVETRSRSGPCDVVPAGKTALPVAVTQMEGAGIESSRRSLH